MAKIVYILFLLTSVQIYTGSGQVTIGPSVQSACPYLLPGSGCNTDDLNIDFEPALSRIVSECPNLLPGQQATIHCDGLMYGSQVVTCLQGGIWNPPSVVCLNNTLCEIPEAPQNGYIVNLRSGYSTLDSIQIRCNDGFDLVGSQTSYCGHDGIWSRKMPKCTAAVDVQSCDRPDVSQSVTLTPDTRTYANGTDVNYSCNLRNHGLLGESSSTCINGLWSPDPGECYVLSGVNIELPSENCQRRLKDGVLYTPMQYSYQQGRSVTFRCSSPDFSLVGHTISTCGTSGWDTPIPDCVPKCPLPSPRTYTRLYPEGQTEYRQTDVINLECNREARTSTCVDGVWTPELEFCSRTRSKDRGITTTMSMTTTLQTSRAIALLVQERVTVTSINLQLPWLISLTTTPEEKIVAEDVHNVMTFLEKVANLNSTTPMVTNSMLEIISNLMNVDEIELQAAQQDNNATNRALEIMDRQLSIVDIESKNRSFVVAHQNLAVRVSTTTLSQSADGSVFAIYRGEQDDDQGEYEHYDELTFGSVDKDFFNHQNFRASVRLPGLTHFDSRFSGNESYRISFIVYQKTSIFVSSSLTILNSRETSFLRRPATPIISATVHGMDDEIDEQHDESIVSTFDVDMKDAMIKNAECVYWDVNGNQRRGDWSSRGCRRVPGTPNTRPSCRCRRLANFAVLLDIYNEDFLPLEFQYFAQILTYVGCGLSTCGLILTIIAYASSSKLRNKQPNQILLCLISSLLGLYTIFMLVISLGPGISRIPCGILAALLHFFALSSLAWMGIEGVNVYLLFVRIINSYIPRFIRKAAVFGWGIPAVIVFVIGCIFRDNYARGDVCLIQRWPNITGLLIPVGLILLFNIVIFILVMKRINSTTTGKVQDNMSTRYRERVRRLRNAFILLILLGLTWLFGFLVNIRNDVLIAFSQAVFVLMNAFQGFFIFLLYCIRQPLARKQLVNSCRYLSCPAFEITKTSVTSDQNKNANVIKDSNEKNKNHKLKSLKMDKAPKDESFDTASSP